MNNSFVIPMVIAAKIHKYFSRFENAGAISPETSKTLTSLGLHGGLIFNRLLRKGVFIEVTPGNYYVSRSNYDKFRAQRKQKALVILGVILVIVIIIISFS